MIIVTSGLSYKTASSGDRNIAQQYHTHIGYSVITRKRKEKLVPIYIVLYSFLRFTIYYQLKLYVSVIALLECLNVILESIDLISSKQGIFSPSLKTPL